MSELPQSPESPLADEPAPASGANQRPAWLPAVVVLGAFLAGLVPMWFKSSRLSGELLRVQRQLRLEEIQLTFANAALEARRGDYEPARRGMADFFRLITAELDRGVASALPAGAPSELQALLAQRDDLITLLARGDPASAERLANAYLDFRKMVGP